MTDAIPQSPTLMQHIDAATGLYQALEAFGEAEAQADAITSAHTATWLNALAGELQAVRDIAADAVTRCDTAIQGIANVRANWESHTRLREETRKAHLSSIVGK